MNHEFICQADYFCSDKREEIIRCRDCKFFDPVIEGGYCNEMRDEDGDPVYIDEGDGFCAWAEKVN